MQLLINCHVDLNAPTNSIFSPLLPPVAAGVFFIQAQALREEEARAAAVAAVAAAAAAAEVSEVVESWVRAYTSNPPSISPAINPTATLCFASSVSLFGPSILNGMNQRTKK